MSPVSSKAAVLYLAGVFLVGAVAGGASGYAYAKRQPKWPGPPKPEDYVKGKCDRLSQELGLTAEDRARIEPVVRETFEKMGQLHKESNRRFDEAREESDKRLAEAIPVDKRARFEELQRERRKRWERFGGRGQPGPGGPSADPGHRGMPPGGPGEPHRGGPPPGTPPDGRR